MIQAVKLSTEPGHLKQETMRYLTGLKGTLVQKKKKEAERKAAATATVNPTTAAVVGQQVHTGTPFHMM